jgi:hypothetical protein
MTTFNLSSPLSAHLWREPTVSMAIRWKEDTTTHHFRNTFLEACKFILAHILLDFQVSCINACSVDSSLMKPSDDQSSYFRCSLSLHRKARPTCFEQLAEAAASFCSGFTSRGFILALSLMCKRKEDANSRLSLLICMIGKSRRHILAIIRKREGTFYFPQRSGCSIC